MTKKQAREMRLFWSAAVADRRVINIGDGRTKKAFPTHAMMHEEIAKLRAAGVEVSIVEPVAHRFATFADVVGHAQATVGGAK